jgi:hypothetical protein
MKNPLTSRPVFATVVIAVCFGGANAHCAPGDLYVADAGNIYKFTPAGIRNTVGSGIYQPVALAFDRSGNLFVGNSGSTACIPEIQCEQPPATIIKITPDGTQSTFATLKTPELLDIAFDATSNLFVSTGLSIVKIAPDGAQSTFASQVRGVWPLAFDRFGNLYAATNQSGPPSIIKFAPDGSRSTFLTFPASGSSISEMAFSLSGDLYVRMGSSIVRIKPDGTRTTFATNDRLDNALAFDSSGVLSAGLSAYSSAEPGIVKFTAAGEAVTFVFGPLIPGALAFEPVTEKLRNISARGLVAGGDNVLISGFIVGGSALANNGVVARAIGPSMSNSGVSNPLSDPLLELHDSTGATIATNNNWQDTQKAEITATGLAPTNDRESAIFATLPAGNYTAVVRSGDGSTGTAVVEVYSVTR